VILLSASSAHLPDELDLALDSHLVGHQDSAGLQSLVPLESPLPAIDLRPEAEACARIAPRVDSPSKVLAVQCDFHGAVADYQVANDLESVSFILRRVAIELPGSEPDLRIPVRIQEVRATQVSVAVGNARVYARGTNDRFEPRLVRVLPIAAKRGG